MIVEDANFVVKGTASKNILRDVLAIANDVRSNTKKVYPHETHERVEIQIYQGPTSKLQGSPGNADVGVHGGTIHILSPTWDKSWNGYEQLENPFKRVLHHEYVHVPFYNSLYGKEYGYRECPTWFSQGVAEYIAENYLPSYESKVKSSVEKGTFDIENSPYAWGLFIVEYLSNEFGLETSLSIVENTSTTFRSAIEDVTELRWTDFEEGWKQYLKSRNW